MSVLGMYQEGTPRVHSEPGHRCMWGGIRGQDAKMGTDATQA